ncbi:MAG: hypothetical protein ACT4QE_01360 [Anaerolineales bacterium]
MDQKQMLLARLDDIGQALERSGHGLALIGLGSVGVELDWLDDHSDLDFFAIVEPGHKRAFIDDLDWLRAVHPIAYYFQNTVDGHKLLFADGIFCEFAVFEPAELSHIPFADGRIVWKRPEVDDAIAIPMQAGAPPESRSIEWLLGEALTNLYVGLSRYYRGEKLSAARFIQGYAVDRVLDLAESVEAPTPGHRDVFVSERRFEQRYPAIARELPYFVRGYERSPESALAILEFLERHFAVNAAMATAIRVLCTAPA